MSTHPAHALVQDGTFADRRFTLSSLSLSHSVRVSPQFSNRLVESSRSLLNPLIPDIYIYSDPYKSAESGLSPGYGLSLLSISTTGAMQAFELGYAKDTLETPEEVGRACAAGLLEEVRKGGCVGEWAQGWVLTAMVLGSEDVGRVRLGELTATSCVLFFFHHSSRRSCVGGTHKS